LERQHVNDNGRVQIRPKKREFNVRRAIRQVNTIVDEFMANIADIGDVDFKVVSGGHEECFGLKQNYQFVRERYDDDFGQSSNYSIETIMLISLL
jgi:hypothetical protein